METRDEILRTMAGAYRKATKKEKGRILDHVVEVARLKLPWKDFNDL